MIAKSCNKKLTVTQHKKWLRVNLSQTQLVAEIHAEACVVVAAKMKIGSTGTLSHVHSPRLEEGR